MMVNNETAAAITRVARLYLAGEITQQDYLDWVNDTLADAGLSRAVEYNFYPFGAVVYREPPRFRAFHYTPEDEEEREEYLYYLYEARMAEIADARER
jgi:hypothetical protein